jgi:hypothetical protein
VDIAPPTRPVRFCGKEAVFHYVGPVSVKPGETFVHALERRGRVNTDLCIDHSRERFITMEPFLKDGQVTMRCLEFTRLTLTCQSCHSVFRFEPLKPTTVRTAPLASQSNGYFPIPHHFCPACGSPAVAAFNPELDYWEVVAKDLDLPVDVTVDFFNHWMRDRNTPAKFIEWIKSIQEEVDAE